MSANITIVPVTYLLDLGVLLQRKLVVVCKVRELLLCQVNSSLGDVVDLALLETRIQIISNEVERGGPDLARLVHQGHIEQLALASRIRPSLHVGLLSDARLDGPVVLIRAEALNGVDRAAASSTAARQGWLGLGRVWCSC